MKIKGIEFSEETIVGWAKKAGISFEKPKPKFEPISIHGGCFIVSATSAGIRIRIGPDYNGDACEQGEESVGRFIEALQKARAFVEKNK